MQINSIKAYDNTCKDYSNKKSPSFKKIIVSDKYFEPFDKYASKELIEYRDGILDNISKY